MGWSDPHSMLMAVAVVALSFVLLLLMRRKPAPTGSKLKRSMSFTSRIMLDGSMPDNGVSFFAKSFAALLHPTAQLPPALTHY